MFTDQTPSFLAPAGGEAVLSLPTLPEASQPRLQLSLDVVMQENYATTLIQHGGFGDWSNGVGSDGFYRHGMTFEPLMNCPGTWTTNHYKDAHFLLSAQFLGVVTAGMHDGLSFILENVTDWQNAIQIGLFSNRMEAMMDGIRAPFGSVVHPQVTMQSTQSLAAVRARAWSVPLEAIANATSCVGYVVVVNVDEQNVVPFQVVLSSGGGGSPMSYLPANATRMFDSTGLVLVGKDGVLKDTVGAGRTNVYCLVKV